MLVGRKVCGRAEGKWSWTCGQRLEKDHPILLSFWNRMPVFLHLWLFTRLTIFINSSPGLRSWAHAVVFKVAWEERKDHVPGQQLISFKKEKEIVAQARRDHFFPRPPFPCQAYHFPPTSRKKGEKWYRPGKETSKLTSIHHSIDHSPTRKQKNKERVGGQWNGVLNAGVLRLRPYVSSSLGKNILWGSHVCRRQWKIDTALAHKLFSITWFPQRIVFTLRSNVGLKVTNKWSQEILVGKASLFPVTYICLGPSLTSSFQSTGH